MLDDLDARENYRNLKGQDCVAEKEAMLGK
jgi:hypothetical protein